MIWSGLMFLCGMVVGISGFILIAQFFIDRIDRPDPRVGQKYTDMVRKVKLSEKYFGQIANRESIGEARKIANHAINKLNEDGA